MFPALYFAIASGGPEHRGHIKPAPVCIPPEETLSAFGSEASSAQRERHVNGMCVSFGLILLPC